MGWPPVQRRRRALQQAQAPQQHMDLLPRLVHPRHTGFLQRKDSQQALRRHMDWQLYMGSRPRMGRLPHKDCQRRRDCSLRMGLVQQRSSEPAREPGSRS